MITATENLFDGIGHYAESGNKYLFCSYLEKIKDVWGQVYCKFVEDGRHIMSKQVLHLCVNMLDNLTLELQEYPFLCDCV